MAERKASDLIPDDYLAHFWRWVEESGHPRTKAGWSMDDWTLHLFCSYLTQTTAGGQVLHNLSKRQIQKVFDFEEGW